MGVHVYVYNMYWEVWFLERDCFENNRYKQLRPTNLNIQMHTCAYTKNIHTHTCTCTSFFYLSLSAPTPWVENSLFHAVVAFYYISNSLQVFVDPFYSTKLNSHLDTFHFALCMRCTLLFYVVWWICVSNGY